MKNKEGKIIYTLLHIFENIDIIGGTSFSEKATFQ